MFIDQKRDGKAKRANTVGDLADLLFGMDAGVTGIRPQRRQCAPFDTKFFQLRVCCLALHDGPLQPLRGLWLAPKDLNDDWLWLAPEQTARALSPRGTATVCPLGVSQS